MSKKPITHLIIDTSGSNQDFPEDDDYAMVELTSEYVANLLAYMDRMAQMHRTDSNVYSLELWDYRPLYFSSNEQFAALRDVYGDQASEVPRGEPILLAASPQFAASGFKNVECQTIQITGHEILWSCFLKHGSVRIETASVVKKTLLEIQRRFGVQEGRRSHNKRRAVPPAIQRIHDLLYLDLQEGRESYDPEKSWDADTVEAIAEVVAEHIPRPK